MFASKNKISLLIMIQSMIDKTKCKSHWILTNWVVKVFLFLSVRKIIIYRFKCYLFDKVHHHILIANIIKSSLVRSFILNFLDILFTVYHIKCELSLSHCFYHRT